MMFYLNEYIFEYIYIIIIIPYNYMLTRIANKRKRQQIEIKIKEETACQIEKKLYFCTTKYRGVEQW